MRRVEPDGGADRQMRMARSSRLVVATSIAVLVLAGCSNHPAAEGQSLPGAPWNYGRCALDRAIINSSHAIQVNSASGAVTSVDFVRKTDPRAAVFKAHPISAGAPVKLTRDDGVAGLSDAGAQALTLVGQPRTDLPDEWAVHAVATIDGSSLRFAGPCSAEFDRQFAALRKVFGGTSGVALLQRMIDEALLPGRGADLHNAVVPEGTSMEAADLLAPRWAGQVRVVSLTVSFAPQGKAGAAGLQSDVGFFGIGVGAGLSTSTVDTMAVIPKTGKVHVLILDDVGHVLSAPLDLATSDCAKSVGMLVDVDLVALTASCHGGSTPDDQARVVAATAQLAFDHAAAKPEFADGPPGQS
jgi:hypothetical protein